MRVVEVKYMRRKNLGNYEHAELAMTSVIEEGGDVDAAIMQTKVLVESHLGLAPQEVKSEKVATQTKEAKPKAEPKPKAAKTPAKPAAKTSKASPKKKAAEVKEFTLETLKPLLQKVAKQKSLGAAQQILEDIAGVTHSKDVKPEFFNAIGAELEKCLK